MLSKTQSKLFLNDFEDREPDYCEVYEALILSSFIALILVKKEYSTFFKDLEKYIYSVLRKENNPKVVSKLKQIGEQYNFINNRFFNYSTEIYQKDNNQLSKYVIDKLYVNPLTSSDEIFLKSNNPYELLKFQSTFSIGYKHFHTVISNGCKLIKDYYDEVESKNPSKLSLPKINLNIYENDFGNLMRIIKPIAVNRIQFIPSNFTNRVYVNNKTEYSYYIKFLRREALLLVLYGFPIMQDDDNWLNKENSSVFVGFPQMLSIDLIEIHFKQMVNIFISTAF